MHEKPSTKVVAEEQPDENLSLPPIQTEMHNVEDRIAGEDIEKLAGTTENVGPLQNAARDDNIVDWDGPDDPEKAVNWPAARKWATILMLATLTLLTPFASSMFAPSVAMVMAEFHSTNVDIGSFVVSVYLLGYAFGPLLFAPLSELYGRSPLYYSSTVLFILFNVACARSTNFPMLIVFRFLTGLAGSCPLTLGAGTVADLFHQEERGRIMAIWTLPVLLGPTIGPIAGGYLSESLGWRWDFWFLIIVRETYPAAILQKRVNRLRKETGNRSLQSVLRSTKTPREVFLQSITRPTKMLFCSPIVLGLSVMTAVTYGTLYLLFTTMTMVFEDQYGISSQNVGLTYLGLGVGQMIGVTAFGMVSDAILRRMAGKGGELKPEYRLPPMAAGVVFIASGLLWYGWSAHFKVMWMMPIIGMVLIGVGVITSFLPVSTYLVDAFTAYAASATAANAVLRSLGGALLPLCGRRMYDVLGLGWGNTLLAGIALASLPVILCFIKYGERIRTHPRFQLNL
ncbi:hypothetical protein BP6252_09057 [Coleophoma cylindrospora]|uniref:Major facilitator superfamily (MFS) profile domain-containing protein n=1 Tax=Coleophoma cylindrospora TaxID=1849047 RepID=A0A3D8R171_9HELO|nr:hypothetical protein BP6252_09057 [Coleophoma cylindrospora]